MPTTSYGCPQRHDRTRLHAVRLELSTESPLKQHHLVKEQVLQAARTTSLR